MFQNANLEHFQGSPYDNIAMLDTKINGNCILDGCTQVFPFAQGQYGSSSSRVVNFLHASCVAQMLKDDTAIRELYDVIHDVFRNNNTAMLKDLKMEYHDHASLFHPRLFADNVPPSPPGSTSPVVAWVATHNAAPPHSTRDRLIADFVTGFISKIAHNGVYFESTAIKYLGDVLDAEEPPIALKICLDGKPSIKALIGNRCIHVTNLTKYTGYDQMGNTPHYCVWALEWK